MEARLSNAFLSAAGIWGTVHSKFHSAINLQFFIPGVNERLLTVLVSSSTGIPDSIFVPKDTFDRLSALAAGSTVWFDGCRLKVPSIQMVLEGISNRPGWSRIKAPLPCRTSAGLVAVVDFRNRLKRYCKCHSVKSGFSLLSREKQIFISQNLQRFATAWADGDIALMETVLLECIGMGIGLTPSCDDAFLGIIAVYSGAKIYANTFTPKKCKYLQRWSQLSDIDVVKPFDTLLSGRTTDVSLKYLCCAQEGYFSDVIIDLIEGIFSQSIYTPEMLIESVARVGGSSGVDTIVGMIVACQALLRMSLSSESTKPQIHRNISKQRKSWR